MNAMQTLKEELDKVLNAQSECMTECGHVKSGMRYRYKILVDQANHLRSCIEWMETIQHN